MTPAEKILLELKQVFEVCNVKFWLAFGTLLGVYRDKALIPYDTDIDLAVFCENSIDLLVALAHLGHKDYGVFLNSEDSLIMLRKHSEKIDLCMFRIQDDKRVWQHIKYDVADFENYDEVEFLGTSWHILRNTEKWLAYTYGNDWKEHIEGRGVGNGYPLGK